MVRGVSWSIPKSLAGKILRRVLKGADSIFPYIQRLEEASRNRLVNQELMLY